MDYKLLLDTAVMAGEVMLRNGAETHRVEDTMMRIPKMSGLAHTEVLVMTTGFMVTLDDKNMDSMTVIRRIESRGTNLKKIADVNEISRQFCQGVITLEEAFHKVRETYRNRTPFKLNLLPMIAVTAGFTGMLGGSAFDIIAAGASGIITAGVLLGCKKMQIHMFLTNIISSFVIAVFADIWIRFLPGIYDMDMVIIGSIMPLVPGAAITNAILDTLYGDYISGGAKILEAFVIAVSVVLGVGIGMALMRIF